MANILSTILYHYSSMQCHPLGGSQGKLFCCWIYQRTYNVPMSCVWYVKLYIYITYNCLNDIALDTTTIVKILKSTILFHRALWELAFAQLETELCVWILSYILFISTYLPFYTWVIKNGSTKIRTKPLEKYLLLSDLRHSDAHLCQGL